MTRREAALIAIACLSLGTVSASPYKRATAIQPRVWRVSPTGNDVSGDGSDVRPWATLNRAFAKNKYLEAGDTILLDDGVYAESSGLGYIKFSRRFSDYVKICPTRGWKGKVTIMGQPEGGRDNISIGEASFIKFENLTFTTPSPTARFVVRIASSGTVDHIWWDHCRFVIKGNAGGQVNYAVCTTFTGSPTVSDLTLTTCDIADDKVGTTRGVLLDALPNGQYQRVSILDSSIKTSMEAVMIRGFSFVNVLRSCLTSTSRSNPSSGLVLGYDASSPVKECSIGTVGGNLIASEGGHAAVIGAISSIAVIGNRFAGGTDPTNGQGLVLKNCSNVRVANNSVFSGALSGLYLKAAKNCTIERNILAARSSSSNSNCFRLGMNSETTGANARASNNLIKQNYFVGTAFRLMKWDGSYGDGGGNLMNQNYAFLGAKSVWGTVYGNACESSSESAFIEAWKGSPYEGINSRECRLLKSNVAFYASIKESNLTTYCIVRDRAGRIWNGDGFETLNPNHYYRYTQPLIETENGSGVYHTTILSALPPGAYKVVTLAQSGAIATPRDRVVANTSIVSQP